MLSRTSIIAAAAVLFSATFNHAQAQFQPGEFITYGQDGWGTQDTPASQLLFLHFFEVYPGGVYMGIPEAAGNYAVFGTPEAVLDYLPASGEPAPPEQ